MAPRPVCSLEVTHKGLHKHREIRGYDRYVVEQKAQAQLAAWEEAWQNKVNIRSKQRERERVAGERQQKKELAAELTKEAEQAIEDIENVLRAGIKKNAAVDWEALKERSAFRTPPPKKPAPPAPSVHADIPNEPKQSDDAYQPKFGLLDQIFRSRMQRRIDEAEEQFQEDHLAWKRRRNQLIKQNQERERQHAEEVKRWQAESLRRWQQQMAKWQQENQEFLQKQRAQHGGVEARKKQYVARSLEGVLDYYEMILSHSEYPDTFPQEFDIEYHPDTKVLILDYSLPPIEVLPKVKQVKYVQSTEEFKETLLPDSALSKLFDDLLYQIGLRTIHEIYRADRFSAVAAVVFNGWVKSVDRATGKEQNACILSVQANRDEFLAINLEHVNPKACFKQLKGVGSAKLSGLAAIAPIISINREDKRFIPSYEVANGLDESCNLAAMDWQDFEHLIREVFEKEFAQGGGEVKVTRASRDGGVDAVAFDPDPIRGGKIVIQAKRYTNTVNVSAVRDLYGTVVNEGAIKGILITTADYGPDSYEFARGKPLALLSGSNLLHLLEKHGRKARIDLKEAKKLLTDGDKAKTGRRNRAW